MTLVAAPREAALLTVTGVVQGVGFRPFVHRLAVQRNIGGWVRNEAGVVRIALEGRPEDVSDLIASLRREAPPLARIDAILREAVRPSGAESFAILASAAGVRGAQPVAPDVALCPACAAELRDPANRRFRYPFITCTDCGPRFSVIETVPYDRERTSMRAFTPCPACAAEYETPGDRRHHCESNSCPACGPRLWLAAPNARVLAEGSARALALAAALLARGRIVAIRGLGGFHLACDATSETAVERLRRRKRRERKPLAVMVAGIHEAEALARWNAVERRLLESPERPIVVGRRRPTAPLAGALAPDLGTVGVMIAYTPLHALLLDLVGRPLVMTSGNLSDEPIAIRNDDALARLAGIADAFLLHDRAIVTRADDSVARVIVGAPRLLRRSRGYAPLPVRLPVAAPAPLLAVGPHLKNTLTLAAGERAYVSQHIGDLEDLAALDAFQDVLACHQGLFGIEPEAVAHDLHPGYLSTRLADETGLPAFAVQHHHAHVAAVAAEHGVATPVVGVAFDGTGYGDDGRVWGAEILVGDLLTYRRAAHLRYAPLPGGDRAARAPWRAALGFLSLEPGAAASFAAAFADVPESERHLAARQIERRLNAPLASSMGRLFDAAAAVLGVRREARFEGQAAMELEALAGDWGAAPLPFPATRDAAGVWIMDPVPLLEALGDRRARGAPDRLLAAAFHESVAATTASVAAAVAAEAGCRMVALGGGCFQNARLLASLAWRLEAAGLRVLIPRLLPPNDGAISYGQAAVAAARWRAGVGA